MIKFEVNYNLTILCRTHANFVEDVNGRVWEDQNEGRTESHHPTFWNLTNFKFWFNVHIENFGFVT